MADRSEGDAGTRGAGLASRGGAIPLFRIAGIQIQIEYSWFLIFLLVLFGISAGYLPSRHPGSSTAAYWSAGLVTTALFFLSILAHELSHALVARRSGVEVPRISLFLFGGVSQMKEEPKTPPTELAIAVVGPLTSFALAAAFFALRAGAGDAAPELASAVLGYLGWINGALGVFNLLPGFPLDGGRVLRALVWWRTGSLMRATRIAAASGRGFATAIMVIGGLEIFAGALLGGVWLILIGFFLRAMAQAGYDSLVIQRALQGLRVRDVLIAEPETVPPQLSVRDLVDRYILEHGYSGFPVVDGGSVLGVVSASDVKNVPPAERAHRTVKECMQPLSPDNRIDPDASLADALAKLGGDRFARLLVMRGDELAGMLTRGGVLRFLELQRLLRAE
jgi:Zn-dependent protease/CBS domain-containing protein